MCPLEMAKESKQESSELNDEPLKQVETALADVPPSAELKTETPETEAVAKARERRERFKALQARAVSPHSHH